MKFEINFNNPKEYDDKFLIEKLGAKQEHHGDFYYLYVELEEVEDLENLLIDVDKGKDDMYSAVISFDPPTIFLDKGV